MTDPKGAAGPCGYAYVVLVAFTRGGESRIAVARWQDKNNKDGSEAWYYQGTSVVETGLNSTNGQFHDLPSIVVDPLRVTGGDPCAHNVYVGWARFNGNAGASVLNFGRATAGSSANWNPTWALRFVGSMDKTNQAVTLAVDPRPGTPLSNGGGKLYYGWRAFKSPNSPDRYWMARSTNFGDTFEKAVVVTGTSAVYPYDQPSLSSDEVGPHSWRSGPTRSQPSRSYRTPPRTRPAAPSTWPGRNASTCPAARAADAVRRIHSVSRKSCSPDRRMVKNGRPAPRWISATATWFHHPTASAIFRSCVSPAASSCRD